MLTRVAERRWPIVAVVVAVALAACGSYTRKDFAAGANAICASTLHQLRALASANGALGRYLGAAVPVVRVEASELSALQRPPGSPAQRALLRRYLAAVNDSVTELHALYGAAQRGDGPGSRRAEAALAANPAAHLATQDGLAQCGAPGATVG